MGKRYFKECPYECENYRLKRLEQSVILAAKRWATNPKFDSVNDNGLQKAVDRLIQFERRKG